VIADRLAVVVHAVYLEPERYPGSILELATIFFAFQIYCDFSGYTDIAIGLALLLGFKLPKNFNSPYKATSIVSFWRRWHMSLSFWLRDYLYIPLGGNRKGTFRTGVNLMITMLLGGLWHGANLRFIIWGALHGIALVVNKLFTKVFDTFKFRFPKPLGWFVTFHFIVITWMVFRAHSLETLHVMWYRMLYAFQGGLFPDIVKAQPYIYIYLLLGFTLHWIPANIKDSSKKIFYRMPVVVKILFAAFILFIIHILSQSDLQPFIYFRF